jgi:hypothetical protein
MTIMTHDEMKAAAEERYRIFPEDCRLTVMMKKLAQQAYFEKLRKQQEVNQEENTKLST